MGLLRKGVKLGIFINPFFLYPISFAIVIFLYLWGWSDLFPPLSAELLLFFLVTFGIFIFTGLKLRNKFTIKSDFVYKPLLNDILFFVVIFLGVLNVLLVGHVPIFDRSHNYREFGFRVLDPVFNTLSIFLSIFFLQSFLIKRKKRFLIYSLVILIFQFFLFRRSTMIWIVVSCCFLLILYYRKVNLILLLAGLAFIPLLSYAFGLYGNYRGNLSETFIMGDLKASVSFRNSGISHNHYISYLYITSPVASLQKNVNETESFLNEKKPESFFMYEILPVSLALRLENFVRTAPPACKLVHPELLVGTFLMTAFCSLGWLGMGIMVLYLLAVIVVCIWLLQRWDSFGMTVYCILSTTITFQVFSNFLNRLDVLIMLFIYPVLFHYLYKSGPKITATKI